MSRKAFLIWGLVMIQLVIIAHAVLAYLTLSKIVDVRTVGVTVIDSILIFIVMSFGIILHLRFKALGRRKRVLAFCLPSFLISVCAGGFLTFGFVMSDIFGAHDRYFNVIHEWAALPEPKPALTWTTAERLNFIFLSIIPANILGYWGLFALLWFGSLDPRTPSKNRAIQFFKTGFQRNSDFDGDVQPFNLAAS